ncbi:glucose-6-phosphate dehydrogenase [Candidatus Clostridium radicumherbarum]|uniref:Glucose-6-phosphate 1-dehydrogenase n=1 Tax=Candidatus Clostridium radicumherbarum TaxID=3381662 RepID=A0ABW8TSK6_9CLOT
MDLSCILVIFGGTGDLTHRKLLPAIYNLTRSKKLPDNFAIVSIGRREIENEAYREEALASIKKFSRFKKIDEDLWNNIAKRLHYKKLEFHDSNGYDELNVFLEGLDKVYNTKGNRIFYLAVSPEYFDTITMQLDAHRLVTNSNSWQRLIIEKPFGRDLASARRLNQTISKVFGEGNTFRIDHYLGKEMIQNLMVLRFANSIFEPLWNNRYIDNIQITSSETVGVENRGGYYDEAGALKDMVQNHMLQLLTLTAMEPPMNLTSDSIRDEKVKVLRSLEDITSDKIKTNIIRAQYGEGFKGKTRLKAYLFEDRVSKVSQTETYVALKLHVENFRWAGVPFYIRTGKRLASKSTEIIVQFKSIPKILYSKEHENLNSNMLVIRVQPTEGIYFKFNTKMPGTENTIIPVQMDFCQSCQFESNTPEAYEKLLFEVMNGDNTLFTSWDEVEYSWKFVDTIADQWKAENNTLPIYSAGSCGPIEANELLKRDNKYWVNLQN